MSIYHHEYAVHKLIDTLKGIINFQENIVAAVPAFSFVHNEIAPFIITGGSTHNKLIKEEN